MDGTLITIPATPPQFSEEHLRQLTVAREALRKIRRTVSVARFDGITVAVFAALTLLMSLTSFAGLALGGVMGLVAFVELRNVDRLRQLNPRAARALGLNQLVFASALIIFSLLSLRSEWNGAGAELKSLAGNDADAARMLSGYEDLPRLIALVVYGAVIAVAIFAQGGLALFYFRREQLIEKYVSETPAWIVAMQRADGSL